MNSGSLIDNDILLKVASYRQAASFSESMQSVGPPEILATARYVLPARIKRKGRFADPDGVSAELTALLLNCTELEPSDLEIAMAADLVEAAQQYDLEFDGGEAILVAILLQRTRAIFISGDKRASIALQKLGELNALPGAIENRVCCLEQLLQAIMRRTPFLELRSLVCAEAKSDQAATLCFSCGSDSATEASTKAGLKSYIENLRNLAPSVINTDNEMKILGP